MVGPVVMAPSLRVTTLVTVLISVIGTGYGKLLPLHDMPIFNPATEDNVIVLDPDVVVVAN